MTPAVLRGVRGPPVENAEEEAVVGDRLRGHVLVVAPVGGAGAVDRGDRLPDGAERDVRLPVERPEVVRGLPHELPLRVRADARDVLLVVGEPPASEAEHPEAGVVVVRRGDRGRDELVRRGLGGEHREEHVLVDVPGYDELDREVLQRLVEGLDVLVLEALLVVGVDYAGRNVEGNADPISLRLPVPVLLPDPGKLSVRISWVVRLARPTTAVHHGVEE